MHHSRRTRVLCKLPPFVRQIVRIEHQVTWLRHYLFAQDHAR